MFHNTAGRNRLVCLGFTAAVWLLAVPLHAQLCFRANALFLDKVNSDQQVVTQRISNQVEPESAVLFTDSVNPDMEAGMELTLGACVGPNTVVEATYFGLHQWNQSASITDPLDQLNAPFSIAGGTQNIDDFLDARTQGFVATSRLHNVELNVRRRLTAPIWFLAGIRYVNYDDQFNFFSIDGAAGAGQVGLYNIGTDNHLLGLQVGGDCNYALTTCLGISANLKTGVFANWVSQDTLLLNNGPPGTANLQQGGASATSFSGLIDGSLRLTYSRGNMSLVCGYRFLILSGMALAPDQLDFSINEDPAAVLANVNHLGTTVLHGPFAGVIFSWP